MQFDITQVIIIILSVGLTIATGIIATARAKVASNYPSWSYALETIVPIAVRAAEQLYGAGRGAEKLEYALQTINDYLELRGFTIDAEVIRSWIEAEVFDMTDGQ